MGFLSDVLAPLASAGGDAFAGYAQDQKENIARAVQAAQMARQQQNDAISNALKVRQMQKLQLGDAAYPAAMGAVAGAEENARTPGKVAQAIQTAKGVAPIHTQEAIDTKRGVMPLEVQQAVDTATGELPTKEKLAEYTAEANKRNAVPTIQVLPGANGQPPQGVVTHGNNVGTTMPIANVTPKGGANSALAAPMAAKVGQAGEMLKKASDLLPMMDNLAVTVGQSAAADVAHNGVGIAGMHIPGTKGVGNLLLDKSPAYAQYQAALSPFILAAAHALSGARINQDQVNQIRQSIEVAPGDLKDTNVIAQKRKNLVDLINSIAGSLPPDAIAQQEGQMDAPSLQRLSGYGYLRRHQNAAPVSGPPSTHDAEFDALMASLRKP